MPNRFTLFPRRIRRIDCRGDARLSRRPVCRWPSTRSTPGTRIPIRCTRGRTASSSPKAIARASWSSRQCRSAPLAYAWSDGYVKKKNDCPGIYVINSAQIPAPGMTVKPDWQKFQGPPSEHFRLAKEHGYDFYAVTDHSQEAAFQPVSEANPAWLQIKREAAASSGARIRGAGRLRAFGERRAGRRRSSERSEQRGNVERPGARSRSSVLL